MIHVDDKNDIIAETRNSVRGGHFDDKCEEIVDKCVESLYKKIRIYIYNCPNWIAVAASKIKSFAGYLLIEGSIVPPRV